MIRDEFAQMIQMTKDEAFENLKTDVSGWNRWKQAHSTQWHHLAGVQLSRASLVGADFGDTTLDGANFDGADLSEADFFGTHLYGASFKGADLSRARFRWAGLEGADFSGALLDGTLIEGADADDVDFTGARFVETVLINLDLSRTKGLETALHFGSSSLDIATIYMSGGKIPKSFLRETGLPEGFIQYIPSLVGAQESIQFYSCFISYSHKDEDFAHRLFSRLRDVNLRVWYAPEEMKGGQKIHEQIETAIRVHDKLLLVLSEASLQSEWVKTEIRNARRQEKGTGKRKVFPVRLVDFEMIRDWSEFDADSGKDLGVELREYFIPDFSEWKDHDKFEAAFARLLRDLKAENASV